MYKEKLKERNIARIETSVNVLVVRIIPINTQLKNRIPIQGNKTSKIMFSNTDPRARFMRAKFIYAWPGKIKLASFIKVQNGQTL